MLLSSALKFGPRNFINCCQVKKTVNYALLQLKRMFSLKDASTALRPFYFLVHPDMFGQHPQERAVNENSLKILNEFLALQQNKYQRMQSKEMMFYVRSTDNSEGLKLIYIKISSNNLRESVFTVLKSCGLSVTHVPEHLNQDTNRPIDWHSSYYAATGKKDPNERNVEKSPELTLRSWLSSNVSKAKEYEESLRFIQDDIERLLLKLKSELRLKSIRCDSVWGYHHFRGCLKSFDRLYLEHPELMEHILKGRELVFSNGTGVSRVGEIVLSSEDVPQTWFTLLLSVGAYDAMLERLPVMECKLSSLLNNICIVRRDKRHCTIMSEEYELLLNKLLNSLRRCQREVDNYFQNQDLSHLQLVVEGESSPLALSSTGQFLIPASVPGTLVVEFIYKNAQQAHTLLQEMISVQYKVETCRLKAKEILELRDLEQDESVTPEQMLSCCTRLIEQHWRLEASLSRSRLRISHYFSVMQDGLICIPWDWVGDD